MPQGRGGSRPPGDGLGLGRRERVVRRGRGRNSRVEVRGRRSRSKFNPRARMNLEPMAPPARNFLENATGILLRRGFARGDIRVSVMENGDPALSCASAARHCRHSAAACGWRRRVAPPSRRAPPEQGDERDEQDLHGDPDDGDVRAGRDAEPGQDGGDAGGDGARQHGSPTRSVLQLITRARPTSHLSTTSMRRPPCRTRAADRR